MYSIILADPPWFYNDRRNSHTRYCGGAVRHYPVMKTDEIISKTPIQANDDCILFLWATWPNLPEALKVIKGWGFIYKTVGFVWVKIDLKNEPFYGIGYYTKSNTEVCLLATKGKPKVKSNFISQIFCFPDTVVYPRLEHSVKPPIHARIVQLMGDLPRIELYARERVDGWHAWGNEV